MAEELTLTLHPKDSAATVHPDASFGTSSVSTPLKISLFQYVLTAPLLTGASQLHLLILHTWVLVASFEGCKLTNSSPAVIYLDF